MFTEPLLDLFSPFGPLGFLILVGLVAFLDAMTFPMLPEMFMIIAYLSYPEGGIVWALALIISLAVCERLGVSSLYYIVENVRVPHRIKHVASKYVDVLFVSDERVVLMDRIVPVVPFIGAFISFCNWNFKKAITYNVLGCLVKYSFLLVFAGTLKHYFATGLAGDVTLVLVLAVVGISLVINYIWDKKRKRGDEITPLWPRRNGKKCAIR